MNLDHVAQATCHRQKGGPETWSFYGANGACLGDFTGHFDMEEATAPIVPVGSGARATLIYVWADGGRPTEKDVHVEELPIIAWRVFAHGNEAILPETVPSNASLLIDLSGGKLLSQEDQTFGGLADALAHYLCEAQAAWDRRHAGAQVEAEAAA